MCIKRTWGKSEGVLKIALGAIYNSYHEVLKRCWSRFPARGTEFFISHRAEMIAIFADKRQQSKPRDVRYIEMPT
jgi:hypothetical protein